MDPKKVAQFEDLPEPPPPYGVIPEHSEEITEVRYSIYLHCGVSSFHYSDCIPSDTCHTVIFTIPYPCFLIQLPILF